MKIGQVCIKIAGRESGNFCVIVDKVDDNFVLVEGYLKRRKCNINHLEPLDKIADIKKGATKTEVEKALSLLGLKKKERKIKKTAKTKK